MAVTVLQIGLRWRGAGMSGWRPEGMALHHSSYSYRVQMRHAQMHASPGRPLTFGANT
jgi:hypothetical protein